MFEISISHQYTNTSIWKASVAPTDLLDGVFLPCYLRHLSDGVDVILEFHFQTLTEGQVGFSHQREA